jgi:hypothetical protein
MPKLAGSHFALPPSFPFHLPLPLFLASIRVSLSENFPKAKQLLGRKKLTLAQAKIFIILQI